MIRLASALAVLALVASTAVGEAVRLEKQGDAVAVSIDGREFTTYHIAKSQPKPYFSPVRAADGALVSRPLENPKDHPHHKGIWCAVDEVNGIGFWEEKGRIENSSVDVIQAEGNPARMRVVNHWLNEGKPLVRETINVSIYANRLIAYDAEFSALDGPLTFGDTKEGLFGIRVADSLRGQAGGQIVNAEGLRGEKECWGKESKWVDYSGQVGDKTLGIAIFDDPRNFRKSRYHVRDYGLFSLSPFGRSAYTNGQLSADPLRVDAGKSFKLRYGLYVHPGDATEGHVGEVYDRFARD